MNNKFKKVMVYVFMFSFSSLAFAGGITVSVPPQQGAGPLPAGNGSAAAVSVGGKVNIIAQKADVKVGNAALPTTVDMKSVLTNLVVNITDNNVNPDVLGAAAAQAAQVGQPIISVPGFSLVGHKDSLRRSFAEQIQAQVKPGSNIAAGLMGKTATYTDPLVAPGGDLAMRTYQDPTRGKMLDFNFEIDKINSSGALNPPQKVPTSFNNYTYQSTLVPLIAQLAYHVKKEVPAAEQAWRDAVSANAGAFNQGLADLNAAVSGTATDVYSAALAVTAANDTLPALFDAYTQALATAAGAGNAAGQVAPAPNTSAGAIASLQQQLIDFQATPDYALLTSQQQTDLSSVVTLFSDSLAQWGIYDTQLAIYAAEFAKVKGPLKTITKTGTVSGVYSYDSYNVTRYLTDTFAATVTYKLISSTQVEVSTTVGKFLTSTNMGKSHRGKKRLNSSLHVPANGRITQAVTSSCTGGVCTYTLGKKSPYFQNTYTTRTSTNGYLNIAHFNTVYSFPVPFGTPPQTTAAWEMNGGWKRIVDFGPHASFLNQGATVTYSSGPNQSILDAAMTAMTTASTAADAKAASANALLGPLNTALAALAQAQADQAANLAGQGQQVAAGVVAASPLLALLNSLQAVSDGLAAISQQAADMAIFTTQIVLDDIRNASDTLLAVRKTINNGNLADTLSEALVSETTNSSIAIGGKQGSPYMLALDTLNAVQTLRSAAMYVYEATRGLNLDKDTVDPTKVSLYVDNLNSSEFIDTGELGLQQDTSIKTVTNYSSIYETY